MKGMAYNFSGSSRKCQRILQHPDWRGLLKAAMNWISSMSLFQRYKTQTYIWAPYGTMAVELQSWELNLVIPQFWTPDVKTRLLLHYGKHCSSFFHPNYLRLLGKTEGQTEGEKSTKSAGTIALRESTVNLCYIIYKQRQKYTDQE